jgi:hypothetical protein
MRWIEEDGTHELMCFEVERMRRCYRAMPSLNNQILGLLMTFVWQTEQRR